LISENFHGKNSAGSNWRPIVSEIVSSVILPLGKKSK